LLRRFGVASGLVALTLFGMPAVAGAQSVGPAYTPHAPTASVDPSATACGSTITASGTMWKGGTVVTITLDGQSLGSATTDGAGSFSTSAVVPNPLSLASHTVTETGLDQSTPPAGVSVSTTLTITSCVGGKQVTRPGVGGSTNLAFTGAKNISLYVGIGLLLVLLGFVLTIVGRRRRRLHWNG